MNGHGEKWTRKREQAVGALLTAATIGRAADAVGVSERTLRRWLKEPQFRRAYLDARRACVDQTVALVQQLGASAVLALGEALRHRDVNARLRAVKIALDVALKGVEVADLEERLAALEAAEAKAGRRR
jgi:hypothetical protein